MQVQILKTTHEFKEVGGEEFLFITKKRNSKRGSNGRQPPRQRYGFNTLAELQNAGKARTLSEDMRDAYKNTLRWIYDHAKLVDCYYGLSFCLLQY